MAATPASHHRTPNRPDLPRPRHRLSTKESPEFVRFRRIVYDEIVADHGYGHPATLQPARLDHDGGPRRALGASGTHRGARLSVSPGSAGRATTRMAKLEHWKAENGWDLPWYSSVRLQITTSGSRSSRGFDEYNFRTLDEYAAMGRTP